jgi:hypothetical protein
MANTELKPAEEQLLEPERKNSLVQEGHAKSSDELIAELTQNRTWKYTLLVFSISLTWIGSPLAVFITSFAGKQTKGHDLMGRGVVNQKNNSFIFTPNNQIIFYVKI